MTDIATIIARERLPADYAETVERWWRPLARQIAQWQGEAGRTIVVGINGAQGSGKSTLCAFLEQALLPELGLKAVTLALDDLYLTQAEREALGRTVHPLLATRGVPGTHDTQLGSAILQDLTAGRPTRIPKFSKVIDDRLPMEQAHAVAGPVDVVLFEGWCVGAKPQEPGELAVPVNDLEAEQDRDGVWRRFVNERLAGDYGALFAQIDHLVMLRPASFESVFDNRLLQERKLRDVANGGTGQVDENKLRAFISTYERITRAMMALTALDPEVIVALGQGQAIAGITHRGGAQEMSNPASSASKAAGTPAR